MATGTRVDRFDILRRRARREFLGPRRAPAAPYDPLVASLPAARALSGGFPRPPSPDARAAVRRRWPAEPPGPRREVLVTLLGHLLREPDPLPGTPDLTAAVDAELLGGDPPPADDDAWAHAALVARIVGRLPRAPPGAPAVPPLYRRPRPAPPPVADTPPTKRGRLGAGWGRFAAAGARTEAPRGIHSGRAATDPAGPC